MKIRQFANLPNIKALNIVAVSSLAIGLAASISAAPAQAVVFSTIPNSELDFGINTTNFASQANSLVPTINLTFNPSGASSIFTASGSFAPVFPLSSYSTGLIPATLSFVSGTSGNSVYKLDKDLVFNFANTTSPTTPLVSFTLQANSTFTGTSSNANSAGFQLLSNTGSFFDNGSDRTNISSLAFGFNDTGSTTGGLYIVQASTTTTAVPEPFTIIGTIIGGTAAFRMRKKLASKN